MDFGDKLSAVMGILGVNNKELADAIGVDASLISRWRSGARLPNKNNTHSRRMSAFFVEKAGNYQLVSLLSLMNLPIDIAAKKDVDFTALLDAWLGNYQGSDPESAVAQFLSRANLLGGQEPVQSTYYDILPALGEQITNESFWGFQGLRDATFKLTRLLLATDSPQTLYLYTDQSISWMNDAQFEAVWHDAFMRCLQKGHKIVVIHNVTRNYYDLFTTIARWLPLYMTGQVEAYYCPQHLSGIYAQTINIVPDMLAITSMSFEGCEDESEVRLITHKPSLDALMVSFNQHLRICRPLLSMYTADTAQKLKNEHLQFLNDKGNNISINATLTSISMPEALFVRSIEKIEPNSANRSDTLRIFRLKQEIFRENLKNYKYKEIMILPAPEILKREGLPLNMSMFFGQQDYRYLSYEDIKEHIAHIIELLNAYKNYQCYLLDTSLFPSLQIQAKENCGVVFTTETDSYRIFYLTQPTVTSAFYNYLEGQLQNIPRQWHDRKNTVERLQQYLEI